MFAKKRKTHHENQIIKTTRSSPSKEVAVDDHSSTSLMNWGLPRSVYLAYIQKGVKNLYEWQVECLKLPHVLSGKNLVYSAPTSGGKTLVSELLCLKSILELRKKAIFVVPYKSMVREKAQYFQELLQDEGLKVGGFTGKHSPHGGFDAVEMAICVIEKANSLVNRLISESKLDELGVLVVDEVHQIGDNNRGYLLEDILTKIMYMKLKIPELRIQIVGMSATLPNIETLASWLDAACYTTTFRPVPLYQYCMLNGTIYNSEGKVVEVVKPNKQFENDQSCITTMCYASMTSDESSVLVFCMSKSHVESLAMKIARDVHQANMKTGKTEIKPEINEMLTKLKSSPVGLNEQVKLILTGGVGIHHAGLSEEERDIMEEGFRACVLRVLVSTSTLCSGVNLPARQVIVRYGPHLAPLMYRQMAGRAGRTGYDSLGKSFLVVNNPRELRSALQLMTQDITAINSCMYQEGGLTTALKQAILEMVSSGAATNNEDLVTFMHSTLLLAQKTCAGTTLQVEQLVTTCLNFLLENEFIRKCQSDDGEKLIPTRLGRACLAASMRPDAALELHQELERSLGHFVLRSDLHLLYMAVPQEGGAHPDNIDWLHWLDQFLYLPQEHKMVASVVGVEEKFIGAFVASRVNRMAQNTLLSIARHSRFRKALALYDLVREKPLNAVAKMMGFSRGQLQSIQQSAAMQAGRVTAFCRELGWSNMEVLMENFKPRLNFGVQVELVELLRISLLDGQHARAVYNANYRSLADVAKAEVEDLEHILLDIAPYEASHKKENESEFAQRKRVQDREMYEFKLKRRAQTIIAEARQLVQDDIGSKIDWTPATKQHKIEKRAEFKICPSNQPSNPEENPNIIGIMGVTNKETSIINSVDEPFGQKCALNSESIQRESKIEDQPIEEGSRINESPVRQKLEINNVDLEMVINLIPEMDDSATEDKSEEGDIALHLSEIIPIITLEQTQIGQVEDVNPEYELPTTRETKISTTSPIQLGHDTGMVSGSSPDIFEDLSPGVIPYDITNKILNNNNITTPKQSCSKDENVSPNIIERSPDLLESSLMYDSALNEVLCQYDEMTSTTKSSGITLATSNNNYISPCGSVSKNESVACQIKSSSTRSLNMNSADGFNKPEINSTPPKLSKNSSSLNLFSKKIPTSTSSSAKQSSTSQWKSPVSSLAQNTKFSAYSGSPTRTKSSKKSLLNLTSSTVTKTTSPIRFCETGRKLNQSSDKSTSELQDPKVKSVLLIQDKPLNPCASSKPKEPLRKSCLEVNVKTVLNKMTPAKTFDACLLKAHSSNIDKVLTSAQEKQDIAKTVNINATSTSPVIQLSNVNVENGSINKNQAEVSNLSLDVENSSALYDILRQYDASPTQVKETANEPSPHDSLFDFAFSSSILENNNINKPISSTITSGVNNSNIITVDLESDQEDSYITKDFEIVTLDHISVFDKFSKEWKNKGKHFSLSVACESIDPVVIGANIVGDAAAKIASYQTYDPAAEYKNMKLVGVAMCWGGLVAYYLDLRNTPGCSVPIRERMKLLECMLHNDKVTFECYNSKEQLNLLHICTDISVRGATLVGDPFIASWLLNPDRKCETLNCLVLQCCPEVSFLMQHVGSVRGNNSLGMGSLGSSPAQLRAAVESCITMSLTSALHPKLKELGLWSIYTEMELPLIRCLVSAEVGGFSMDLGEARRIIDTLQELRTRVVDEARKYAYPHFNLDSRKELSNVLYNKLNLTTSLPNGKRTKTYKTDKESLLEMAQDHCFPKLIVDYRSINYILTQILLPLLRSVEKSCEPDDTLALVHPSYLIRSATGRLYMCEPNLQNIPRDLQVLDTIIKPRNQFKAAAGNILISADYCQIELRMLAHFSQDPQLLEILNSSQDIFKEIAARALNTSISNVTDELRQQAKVACYSFIYGKTEAGASKTDNPNGVSLQFISQQMVQCFQTAFKFLEQVKKDCSRVGGSVTSLRGRQRWLNKKNSSEKSALAHAQRQAVNTLMQSSAADIVKTAMIRLHNMLEESNLAETTKLVLHIHDELILETTEDNKNKVLRILRKAMECDHNLQVSLPVKLRLGASWGELKEIRLQDL